LTDRTSRVSYSGFGVLDNADGVNGYFVPKEGFDQQDPLASPSQSIAVTATYRSDQGCPNSITRNFEVFKKLTPSFNSSPTSNKTFYCYNDNFETLTGSIPLGGFGQYRIAYIGAIADPDTVKINGTSTNFLPKSHFDQAVADNGASVNSDAQFNVEFYIEDANNDNTCSAIFTRTYTVTPIIPVTIGGLDDGEKYCFNEGSKQLSLFPPNGNLFIDGAGPQPLVGGDKFVFSPSTSGPRTLRYEITSGATNCPNLTEIDVESLPSPVANFTSTPNCEGVQITFNAVSNPNNNDYKWKISGEEFTGSSINYTFADANSYPVRLITKAAPLFGITCADSIERSQVIGKYPEIEFTFKNTCKGEDTEFLLQSLGTPVAKASWDFGDGNTTTSQNTSSNIIPPDDHLGKTFGTYLSPKHNYPIVSGSATYTITLSATTLAESGNCTTTTQNIVPILESLSPSTSIPYSMLSVDSEAGFWIAEDKNGKSTWAFDTPSASVIPNDANAWVTNPSGNYWNNDESYVNSPCLNLTGFTRPVISLDYFVNTDSKDGAILEYSTTGGASWNRLGGLNTGLNWYNKTNISAGPGAQNQQIGWSDDSQEIADGWLVAKHSLSSIIDRTKVRFRIAFESEDLDSLEGFAFKNVRIEERNRVLLVENFTNQTAGNFAVNKQGFQSYPNTTPTLPGTDEMVKIQYHTNIGGLDAINSLNESDPNARAAFFGITQSTRGYIDGYTEGDFATPQWALNFYDKRTLVASSIAVNVPSLQVLNGVLKIDYSIDVETDLSGNDQYNIIVALIQKNLGTEQFVLRELLPNAAGTPLTIKLATDAPQSGTVTTDLFGIDPADYSELAVVVFVQSLQFSSDGAREVLQTKYLDVPTIDPSTIITSVESPLDKLISVYPNPANDNMVVKLQELVRENTNVTIIDQFGRSIEAGIIEKGKNEATVSVKTLADGVYILSLQNTQFNYKRKVMVVHK